MSVIDEIKKYIGILEVVKKLGFRPIRQGKNYFINSIYKNEKSPSLLLNISSNKYYCFATGQGGDVIQFYQDACNIDKTTAIKELAEICGITRENIQLSKRSENYSENYFNKNSENVIEDMTEEEKEVYYERLGFTDSEKEALKTVKLFRLENNKKVFKEFYEYCQSKGWNEKAALYLITERKLDWDLIKRFKIFCVDNYFEVNNHLKKLFPLEMLQKSGLFNQKGNLIFFAHRIIIPYLHNNEIIYLRGRYFDQDNNTKTDRCKYIGLGNDLLGLNATKRFFNTDILNKMLPGEKLFLVEGEFDCVALEQIGYNTLCIPGASNIPTLDKFKRLLHYNILFCGDNDEAGKGLLSKLTEIFAHYKKEFTVKELPTKDINEFLVVNG